jgi:hypothetical protein
VIYIRVRLACKGRRRASKAYYCFNYINNSVLEMRVIESKCLEDFYVMFGKCLYKKLTKSDDVI